MCYGVESGVAGATSWLLRDVVGLARFRRAPSRGDMLRNKNQRAITLANRSQVMGRRC